MSSPSKVSKSPYSLQKAREDVRRLLATQRRIAFDEFAFVFRMEYGYDLKPGWFGLGNLQQIFERKMIDIVKIGGATHCDRFVELQGGAAPAGSARQSSRPSEMASSRGRRKEESGPPVSTGHIAPRPSSSSRGRGPAYTRSFIVEQPGQARPYNVTPRPPTFYTRPPYGARMHQARYPVPVFVAPTAAPKSSQSTTADAGTGRSKRWDASRLIKELETRAKDFARECVAKGKHVDSSRICQAILRERNVDSFKRLGLRGHHEIPYIKELELLQRRVYETVTAYCQVRSTSTLYELGLYLAQVEGKESFNELCLGPLLEQPAVYQYFKPRQTLRGVPDITTKDVLECLRSFMIKYDRWYRRIEITEFMSFMAKERGCGDPYELCVRVPSLGLPISVLRKAQKSEKQEWRRIRDEIARETTEHIEHKLRTAVEHLLGTGKQLSERARIDEIAEQPANEVVQHVFMYLSHRDMFPADVNEAMRRFFGYVSANQFASKLFKLAICRGTIEDPEQAQAEYVEDGEDDAEESEEDEEQNENNESNKEYDVDWDRKHHRQVVPEDDVAAEICKWLDQTDDLDLRVLAQIEARVATSFEAPEFTHLDHGSFLYLVTHNNAIAYMLEKSSLQFGASANDREQSAQAYLKQAPRENVLDFLQQCGTGTQPISLSQAICDQFGVVRVEDLRLGSIERLIKRAQNHRNTNSVTLEGGPVFPRIAYQSALLCGSTQLESSHEIRTAAPGGSGSGPLGWQTEERAARLLLSCPFLGDLSKWSHWDEVFAPSHGPLKDFISTKAAAALPSSSGVFALEVEPGVYLRVNPRCSMDAFADAVANGDSLTAAVQIIGLIIESGNVGAFALSLAASRTRTALERLVAAKEVAIDCESYTDHHECGPISDASVLEFGRHPAVQFILEMFLRIPHKLSVALSQQVLLEPLHHIVGAALAPKLLLQHCRSEDERTSLQRLGIAFSISEWVQDFERRGQPPPAASFISNKLYRSEIKQESEGERGERKNETLSESGNDLEVVTCKHLLVELTTADEGTVDSEKTEEDEWPISLHDDNTDKQQPISSPLRQSQDTSSTQQDPSTDNEDVTESYASISDVRESSVDAENETIKSEETDLSVSLLEDDTECKAVVDDILREEFGEGLELGPEEAKLVQKQRLREGRGLHRLSSELYSKDTHFVLELVQNADDNAYPNSQDQPFQPAVVFVVTRDCITVLNNELGFQDNHIRALCDVGRSTKGKHTKGYIGQKGIGFKSVFRVTDTPEVHSGGYHIKFNAQSGPLGYICPHWIPLQERGIHAHQLDGIEGADDEGWTTKIILPLKSGLCGQVKSLAPRFHDVQPSLLLFLNRLRSITIVDKVNKTERYMNRRDLTKNLFEVHHSLGVEKWLVVRKELDASKMKVGIGYTEVAVGFPLPAEDILSLASPLQQNLPQQKVFAFLPLRSYGLRFIIQADFDVPSSREAVDESSSWNQWLRSHIASLFVKDGLKHFKELDDMPTLEALCVFLRFVPLEAEVQGFFQGVTREIVQLLKGFNCMPVLKSNPASPTASTLEDDEDIDWVQPSQAVIAKDRLLYDVLPVGMLKDHLDLHYLHPKVAGVLNPGLARCLGVEELSSKHLIKSAETLCALHSQQSHSSQLTLSWIAKWLLCLSRAMIREFKTSTALYESFKTLAIVPLSNGNFVSLRDTVVFFPLDDGDRKLRSATGKSYLDAIYNDMRTVSKEMLSMQSNAENASVHRLLEEMGVKRMTSREIVYNHIIPILESDDWRGKSPGLVVSYLVFLKEQCDRDPNMLKIDQLKTFAVLLTNQGQLRPKEEIIHFSSIYLQERKFDLQRHFPEVSWKVVDQTYLQISDASNPALIHSWETFLRRLGVEQFLAVRERTIELVEDELSASPWGNIAKAWPKSKDEKYRIRDYTCPEFLAVVGSVTALNETLQKERMKSLVELFNHNWSLIYNARIKAVVMGASGEPVCETESTFYMELKRTLWIPTVVKRQQSPTHKTEPSLLHRPDALFLNDKKTAALLHCHVDYVDATINNPNFTKCLGLHTSEVITVEFILIMLREWSGPSDVQKQFSTSLRHMSSVYEYLLGSSNIGDKQDPVRLFFQQERAFFVPFHTVDNNRMANDIVPGTFVTFDEVCWEDSTGVLRDIVRSARESAVPGPKLLSEVYQCIGENECRALGKLFLDKLDLNATPTIFALLDVMEYVAAMQLTPTYDILQQIQKLYMAVSHMVRESAEKEAYETARKSNTELPSFAKFKSLHRSKFEEALLEEGVELHVSDCQAGLLVRTRIAGKPMFASIRNKWVSADQQPMIKDNPSMADRFADHPVVHFLWPVLESRSSQSFTSSRAMELGALQRQKRLHELQSVRQDNEKDKIYEFFAICGIKKLSKVVCEDVHESGVGPSPQLQLRVKRLLPFIQKYLFNDLNYEYQQLQDEGISERLLEMRFSLADKIFVSLVIKGLNIHSDKQETDCALSNREVLIVSRQAWASIDDNKSKLPSLMGRELAKVFLSIDHNEYSTLESFIENLLQCLPNQKELKKFVQKWKLPSRMPEDEQAWTIPEPDVAQEASQQEQQERLQEELLPSKASNEQVEKNKIREADDGKLRSWPPRSSTQPPSAKSLERSQRDKPKDEQKRDVEWSMPQQPEQWQGPDGQMPPSRPNLHRDRSKVNSEHDGRSDHLESRILSTQVDESSSMYTTDVSTESHAAQLQSRMLSPHQTLPQFDPSLGPIPPMAMPRAPFINMQLDQRIFHGSSPAPFPQPFTPNTVSSIEFEEVARAPQLRPPVSVVLHPQSPQQEVGRYGEELIFLYLLNQRDLGLLTYDDQPVKNVAVLWVNQRNETGYPFDIQVNFFLPGQQTPKSHFIEVKTTRSPDKGLFQISNNELRFAHQQRDAFYVYRVFNAGNAAVKVGRIRNLSQYLDSNQVQLYIEI